MAMSPLAQALLDRGDMPSSSGLVREACYALATRVFNGESRARLRAVEYLAQLQAKDDAMNREFDAELSAQYDLEDRIRA